MERGGVLPSSVIQKIIQKTTMTRLKFFPALILGSTGLIVTSLPVSAALLAHYSFDSDYSLTGGTYNGTLSETETGGATVAITSTTGQYKFGGGAANFTSTISNEAYLGMSIPINFAAGDAWSISFWVRRAAGSDNRQGMVAGDRSDTNDFLWASDNSSQVQGMRYRSSVNTNADFGGHPDDGNFHHWVVIHNGSGGISAYRDNVAQTGKTAIGGFTINTIGHAYNATTFSMNGQIDELYIFNEAIDSATVSSLFNFNVVPEPSAIIIIALGGMIASVRRNRRG